MLVAVCEHALGEVDGWEPPADGQLVDAVVRLRDAAVTALERAAG
jgi:hypothetical protein